jgi:hypothetical protein
MPQGGGQSQGDGPTAMDFAIVMIGALERPRNRLFFSGFFGLKGAGQDPCPLLFGLI